MVKQGYSVLIAFIMPSFNEGYTCVIELFNIVK